MIGREITKIHESFYREEIDNLKMFKKPLKGELTVVISENYRNKVLDHEKITILAKKYLKKYSLKDTVDLISKIEKINKRELYKICLRIKNEKNS